MKAAAIFFVSSISVLALQLWLGPNHGWMLAVLFMAVNATMIVFMCKEGNVK